MTAIPFALVSADNHDKVFAYGLDIELDSGWEVVTFRRNPGGKALFGVHQSVESARRRFSTVTPLEILWET
jgi:uncharacterized protein (UPF0548 family)